MTIEYNGNTYEAVYNPQTRYYEVDLVAPQERWSIPSYNKL